MLLKVVSLLFIDYIYHPTGSQGQNTSYKTLIIQHYYY